MSVNASELENLRISGDSKSGSEKAICLLVHGRGGKHELMRWMSKRFKLPSLDYALIQAPHPEFVPEMKTPGFSWFLRPDATGIEESRKRIDRYLNKLVEESYKPERIFWIGFSQGGVMGIDAALRGSLLLGGVVCVSGFALNVGEYPQAFGPHALDQKIVATHGPRDTTVELNRAKASYDALRALGVDLEFREYNKPHSFDLKKEIPDIEQQLKNWMA